MPRVLLSRKFNPAEARDYHGRWIVSGSSFGHAVADTLATRFGGEFATPAARERTLANFGGVTQHQDHEALQSLEDAEQRNADDGQAELYPTFGHPPVRLEEKLGEGIFGSLALAEETHLRVSAKALRRNDYLNGKRPRPKPGDFTTAHDTAPILRHEWFHHAERSLSPQERSAYLSHLPRTAGGTYDYDQIARDLSLNASSNQIETAAELYALASDPKADLSKFPAWVQAAGYATVEALYQKAGIA